MIKTSFKDISAQETHTKFSGNFDFEQATSVVIRKEIKNLNVKKSSTYLIGIHSVQGGTATKRHATITMRSTKRFKHIGNLFKNNLQLEDVC